MADNNYTYEVIRKALDRDDDGGTCTPSDVDAAYQALNALLTENANLRAFVNDCTTAVIYIDGQAIRLIDGDIGKRAAALLAESKA